jgi:hypothetical protein
MNYICGFYAVNKTHCYNNGRCIVCGHIQNTWGNVPVSIRREVRDMVDGLETITYYKHHYVRKTGLKREIKKLISKALVEQTA